MINVIDTHTHLDAVEFNEDRAAVFERARAAGVCKVFLPAIDLKTARFIMALSQAYPGYAYPMVGLHPEEVREDWFEQLTELANIIRADRAEAKEKGDARGRIMPLARWGSITIGAASLPKSSSRPLRCRCNGRSLRAFP